MSPWTKSTNYAETRAGIVFIRPDESDGLDGVRRAGGPWGRRARSGLSCESTRTTSRSPLRTSCSGSRKSNGNIRTSTCSSTAMSTRFARGRRRRLGQSPRRSKAARRPRRPKPFGRAPHSATHEAVGTAGAIAYHDFNEARGYRHYRSSPDADDIVLREHFLDRVYDTLADESLFRECDDEIAALADSLEPRPYSSREILWDMGRIASKDPNSLVGTCYRKGIPYFVPALNDSSIGIALAKHHHDRVKKGKEPIALDSIKDNYEIAQVKLKSPRTGVFYVGGGTPKNYISQVEVIQEVMGYPENPHMYAAQITTDVPQWGGLSGCTFEESQSWGKFHKDAKMAQSLVDATIGLPILIGYLLQKGVPKKRKQKRYRWEGEELVELK